MDTSNITKFRYLLMASLFALLVSCGQTISDDEYLQRAQAYLADSDSKAAAIELKNALLQNAENQEARLRLAQLYVESGDVLSAEKELLRLQSDESFDRDNQILPLLAEVWVRLGKGGEALKINTEGLDADSLARVLAAQSQADIYNSDLEIASEKIEAAGALVQPENSHYVRYAEARLLLSQKKYSEASNVLGELHASHPDEARIWALHGDVQQLMGNPELSHDYYSNAIELDPGSPLYLMKRAYLSIQLEDYHLAQKDIDVLMRSAPQSTQVNYAQGLVHFFNKEYEDAVSAFLIAKSEKFRFSELSLYLGLSYFELKDMDNAYSNAQDYRAINRDSSTGNKLVSALLIVRGEHSEAERLVQSVLSRNPSDIPALNILASALMSQSRIDEAIEVLAKVVELDPESGEAKARLGFGYASSGKTELALDSIKAAITSSPQLEQTEMLLALTHLKNNDYDSALEVARAYQERDPFEVGPLLLLGKVYESMRDTESARKSYLDAINLEPGNPSANHKLAVMAFAKNDINAAKSFYNKVLETHEHFLPTLMGLAVLDASIKDYNAMVSHLNRALDHHPDAIEPKIVLARHYLSTGQAEKVQQYLTGLPEEWQNAPLVLRLFARAQYRQGMYSDMRYSLEKIETAGLSTSEDHQSLAAAYEQLGNSEKMEAHIAKALALDPNNLSALLAKASEAYSKADGPSLEKYLSRIEKLAPDNIELMTLQAGYARVKGDQQGALGLFQKIYEALPSTSAMLNLQQQYQRVGDMDSSLSLMQNWLLDHKDDLPVRLALANQFVQTGDIAAVEREYKAILDLDERNLIALNNLAWALKESKPTEALSYAQTAARISNNAPAILDTLALVQSANAQHEKAWQTISSLLAADSNNPTLRYHSALIAFAADRKDEGRSIMQTLIDEVSVFPERNEALEIMKELSVKN